MKKSEKKEEWEKEYEKFLMEELGNNLKNLNNLETPDLKKTINILNKYNIDLQKKNYEKKKEIKNMTNEIFEFEKSNNRFQKINENLEKRLLESNINEDLKKVMKKSLENIFKFMGWKNLKEISFKTNNLSITIDELVDEMNKITNNVKKFSNVEISKLNNQNSNLVESVDSDNKFKKILDSKCLKNFYCDVEKIVDKIKIELKRKFKIINRDVCVIDNNYQSLFHDLKTFYLNFSEKRKNSNLEILQNMILVSKNDYSDMIKNSVFLKKNINKLNSKNSGLTKLNEKFSNNIENLENKIFYMKKNIEKLKKNNRNVENRDNNKKEIEGHLGILKLLQEENYKLNINTKKILDENMNLKKKHKILKKSNEELKGKLKDMDIKNIGALRQERLKLNQSKKNIENFKEKNKKFENLLIEENNHVEKLFKKIKTKEEEDLQKDKIILKLQNNLRKALQEEKSVNSIKSKLTIKSEKDKKDHIFSKEKIENLNLDIVSLEIRLSAERNAFDQILFNLNKKIKLLNNKIKEKENKIKFLTNNRKYSQDEIKKLNDILNKININKSEIIITENSLDSKIEKNQKSFHKKKFNSVFLNSSINKNFERLKKIHKHLKIIYTDFVILLSNEKKN